MESNSEELDENENNKARIVNIDDVLTTLKNKHEINLKLRNKCNKLLKKYLKTVEENLIVKRNYDELMQRCSDTSSNAEIQKNYNALREEFNKLQTNHFEYVNNSEIKYQSACQKIDELSKEIEELRKNKDKLLKSTLKTNKLENEIKETKKLLKEAQDNYQKLEKSRNNDLKQIAALKLERDSYLHKNKEILKSPKKLKLKKVKQLQEALADKENELDILNLAHDKDIEAIKNRYEKEIQKLLQKSTESLSIGTQTQKNIGHIGTQTQSEEIENFENRDVDDILKEMTSLPVLVPPLISSDENIDEKMKTPKSSPKTTKFKVKNNFSKILKREKLRRNQIRTLTKLLGLKRRSLANDAPFVFIPKNCEVKNLNEFLQTPNIYAQYFPLSNLGQPYGPPPNIINPYFPYYAYNTCPQNFCCSQQTPYCYENYSPRIYPPNRKVSNKKRNIKRSPDEQLSKYNIKNFVKAPSLKREILSNQNSDVDEPKRQRKRVVIYSSDENSDVEFNFLGPKDPEIMSVASTVSEKNVRDLEVHKSSSNFSTITLDSFESFEKQKLSYDNVVENLESKAPASDTLKDAEEPNNVALSLNSITENLNSSLLNQEPLDINVLENIESQKTFLENTGIIKINLNNTQLSSQVLKPRVINKSSISDIFTLNFDNRPLEKYSTSNDSDIAEETSVLVDVAESINLDFPSQSKPENLESSPQSPRLFSVAVSETFDKQLSEKNFVSDNPKFEIRSAILNETTAFESKNCSDENYQNTQNALNTSAERVVSNEHDQFSEQMQTSESIPFFTKINTVEPEISKIITPDKLHETFERIDDYKAENDDFSVTNLISSESNLIIDEPQLPSDSTIVSQISIQSINDGNFEKDKDFSFENQDVTQDNNTQQNCNSKNLEMNQSALVLEIPDCDLQRNCDTSLTSSNILENPSFRIEIDNLKRLENNQTSNDVTKAEKVVNASLETQHKRSFKLGIESTTNLRFTSTPKKDSEIVAIQNKPTTHNLFSPLSLGNKKMNLLQTRRSLRLRDKTSPKITPVNKNLLKAVSKINEKVEILDENKFEMLGFTTDEIRNDNDKRHALILHEIIAKYEIDIFKFEPNILKGPEKKTDLSESEISKTFPILNIALNSSSINQNLIPKANIQTNLISDVSKNKIKTPVNCDVVTFYKQKRRVAHSKISSTSLEQNFSNTLESRNSIKHNALTLHKHLEENISLNEERLNLGAPKLNSVNRELLNGSEVESLTNLKNISCQKKRNIKTLHKKNSKKAKLLKDLFDEGNSEMEKTSNLSLVDQNKSYEEQMISQDVFDMCETSLEKQSTTILNLSEDVPKNACNNQKLNGKNSNKNENQERLFKRPEKSKYKIIPDTPRSPDFFEYVKEEPKIIPLKRITSMRIRTIKYWVTSILDDDTEIEEKKLESTIKLLAKQDMEKIAQGIVEVASLAFSLVYDKTFTPLAPLLTKQQQKVLVLINKLVMGNSSQTDLPEFILQYLEKCILKEHRLDFIYTYTRLYIAVVMLYFDCEKMRLMCINAAYKLDGYFLPFMFITLTMFPEVLPTKQQLADQPAIEKCLPQVFMQIVRLKFKNCSKQPGFNAHNLFSLLQQFYEYDSDFCGPNLIEDLVKLYSETCSKIVYTAIVLLCKNSPSFWTHSQINKYFIPLVNKNLQNPNCTELVNLTIHLVTRLVQPFFYDQNDKPYLKNVIDWLQGFLEVINTLPLAIRNVISICCVQLSKKPFYEKDNKIGQNRNKRPLKGKGKKKKGKVPLKKKPNSNL